LELTCAFLLVGMTVWERGCSQGHFENVMSSPIPWDADEPTMRLVLQEQLQTGRVYVNRFGPNQQLGYRWRITFMGQPEGANLPLLVVRVSCVILSVCAHMVL
jgi:hypothetical protein